MKKFEDLIKNYMLKNFGAGLIYTEDDIIKSVYSEAQLMTANLKEGYIDSYYLKDEETFTQWLDEWTAFFSIDNPIMM